MSFQYEMSTFQVSSISTNIFSSNIGCTITPFDFSELRCQCLIDTRTQLWSIVKEKWKSSTSISPEFSKEFFIMYGKGCSVAIDRKTILFIGGHHLYKLQDSDIEHEFVPINNPFNDLVYQYNFMDRKWTELPKVPNVKVIAILIHIFERNNHSFQMSDTSYKCAATISKNLTR